MIQTTISKIYPPWPVTEGLYAFTTTCTCVDMAALNPQPGPIQALEQTHGADVFTFDHITKPWPKADAMVTQTPHITCLIKTADCLPILLYHPPTQTIGAVHAGWRSLALGVIENTLAQWPKVQREQTWAYLGPSISTAYYEVGAEVSAAFAHIPNALVPGCNKDHLDLKAVARYHLNRGGIQRITTNDHCTYRESDLFFSYRRDGATIEGKPARLFTCIGLKNIETK